MDMTREQHSTTPILCAAEDGRKIPAFLAVKAFPGSGTHRVITEAFTK
ncbi:hypothetical protein LEMLEM_LOCUS6960 [Lemmus lemmus]